MDDQQNGKTEAKASAAAQVRPLVVYLSAASKSIRRNSAPRAHLPAFA